MAYTHAKQMFRESIEGVVDICATNLDEVDDAFGIVDDMRDG